jgi:hypothetical protein
MYKCLLFFKISNMWNKGTILWKYFYIMRFCPKFLAKYLFSQKLPWKNFFSHKVKMFVKIERVSRQFSRQFSRNQILEVFRENFHWKSFRENGKYIFISNQTIWHGISSAYVHINLRHYIFIYIPDSHVTPQKSRTLFSLRLHTL